MIVAIYSYSIKYREKIPFTNPNFVFDCRGVKNPGRVEDLKPLTGKDQAVIEFMQSEKSALDFLAGLNRILIDTFPTFLEKQYSDTMSIGFCCTGGRHRSVYYAEKIAHELSQFEGVTVKVEHLDVKNNYY